MTRIKELEAENAVLKDLLETAYRKTDAARFEGEKADDEALELKTEMARLKLLGTRQEVALVFAWKNKYEALLKKSAKK